MEIISVLLIDDDPVINFIHHTVINNLKIAKEIRIEGNGKNALTYLKEYYLLNNSLPDLILVDIHMPVMDGFEFLEEYEKLAFKTENKPTIIVLSNLFNPSDLKILNKIQYLFYMEKPLYKEKLIPVLKEHFQFEYPANNQTVIIEN